MKVITVEEKIDEIQSVFKGAVQEVIEVGVDGVEVIGIIENHKKNDSLQRVANENNSTLILSQSVESLNTESEKSEAVRYIEETSRLFVRLYAKHGDYFMKEYEPHHQVMLDLFTALDSQELKDALRLPNNIFKGCIEKELKKRRFRAEALRIRGKLRRTEEKSCLI